MDLPLSSRRATSRCCRPRGSIFYQRAALPSKDVEFVVRVALQATLQPAAQPLHPAPMGMTGGNPHPNPARQQDHRATVAFDGGRQRPEPSLQCAREYPARTRCPASPAMLPDPPPASDHQLSSDEGYSPRAKLAQTELGRRPSEGAQRVPANPKRQTEPDRVRGGKHFRRSRPATPVARLALAFGWMASIHWGVARRRGGPTVERIAGKVFTPLAEIIRVRAACRVRSNRPGSTSAEPATIAVRSG
jgi:hypothetical protein